MSPEFWAIIAVGIFIVWGIDDARKRIEKKLEILIEEVRYPNLEAHRRDLLRRSP